MVCKTTENCGIKTLTSPFCIYLAVLCHYLLTAAVSSFAGYVHTRGPFIIYFFFAKMITRCWGLRKVKKYNPFYLAHTHTKFAHPHTDCKCNVSVWESEPAFLDPKAITGPASSPAWPPAPHGQRFSQVAHVWQDPFMNTAVAPTLQGAPGSPQF